MGDLNELVGWVFRDGSRPDLPWRFYPAQTHVKPAAIPGRVIEPVILQSQAAAALTSLIAERDGLRERVNALQHAEADRRIWRQFYGALLAVPPDDAIPLEVRVHRQAQIITSMQYRLRNLRREIRRHIGRDPLEPLQGYHVGRHVNKLYSLWQESEAQLKAARELADGLNVTDQELVRINNMCVGFDGDVKIWAKMLQKLVVFAIAARTALSLDTNKGDGV